MKIHYLGTCSGTEPMQGMHHCSLVFEIGEAYYWFDAGENCVHTAYTSGMDVTRTRCVFISHPHIDHIGGFPNLLACIRKLVGRYKTPLKYDNTLKIFTPDLELVTLLKRVACSGVENPRFNFKTEEYRTYDGVIYEDEQIRITAVHNNHLREEDLDEYHSYSFLIEAEGRRVVFSGDVLTPSELDAIVEGVDLLIMETGHHSVADVCEYAKDHGIKKLRFNHHGREILGDRAAAEDYTANFGKEHGIDIVICHDTLTEEI